MNFLTTPLFQMASVMLSSCQFPLAGNFHEQKKGQRRKETKSKELVSLAYDSMLSMFDYFAANGSVATEVRSSMEGSRLGSPGHGYEVGDMVWGKVKPHPWWPGHVFSEEFATTSVRRSKREGLLLVAFFGDSSYGWFDPSELMPFESNFAEKSRQTNSKTFVKAVEEAMDEVSRRNALADYEPGAVYSINAIEKSRASFQPSSTLDFIRQLALEPIIEHAFGHELDRPSPAKAPLSGRQVFADTSGKGKNPARPNKSKENAKKDKYLFKRKPPFPSHGFLLRVPSFFVVLVFTVLPSQESPTTLLPPPEYPTTALSLPVLGFLYIFYSTVMYVNGSFITSNMLLLCIFIAMTSKFITLLCYWDGKICDGEEGITYNKSPNKAIKVQCGIQFNELIDQIHIAKSIDKQKKLIKVICRYPSVVGKVMKYIPLSITDDNDVEIMFDAFSLHQELSNIDLYLEVEVNGIKNHTEITPRY
ncbi:unnamed protein product [Lactuca virosa]|uniref:PWWP domain-containing protein n=1 Tax=Lactuca virosa TaxID=75947 RepID=A0AAU9PVW0_9ASTR|nr:unnamed protein product [Lactuca virosa]